MRKLGIFGGTFNPIHNGHINLALNVRAQLELDEILVIPANTPPHKQCSYLASAKDRIEMCRLACQDHDFLTVSDIEAVQQTKNYTVETLLKLHEMYKDSRFYLMMGSDMFLSFEKWYRYGDIMKLAVLCTAPREEGKTDELLSCCARYEQMGASVKILSHFPVMELSSTQVRELLGECGTTNGLLDERVEEYIMKHGLYEEKRPVFAK
ncbi:MAG: nicotinate (nicotinamide) nucleotide adenylyltransferase [Oscillospiraceae bacterium]|nr:nicotinate (nicotinamide) nucleotide adenylyltransferase [Oscillospiraceae bacterium]